MDLAFGVDKDSAEEEDEAAKGQNCGCYELQVDFHMSKISNIFDIILWSKKSQNDPKNSF